MQLFLFSVFSSPQNWICICIENISDLSQVSFISYEKRKRRRGEGKKKSIKKLGKRSVGFLMCSCLLSVEMLLPVRNIKQVFLKWSIGIFPLQLHRYLGKTNLVKQIPMSAQRLPTSRLAILNRKVPEGTLN